MATNKMSLLRDIGLAAFLGSSGAMHFVNPEFFEAVVPEWFPIDKGTTVSVSGAAEIAVAAMVAIPKTRRLGGWAALALFIIVFPANIDGAIGGGYRNFDPPMNTAAAAWGRLPFQFPMFYWAYKVAKGNS